MVHPDFRERARDQVRRIRNSRLSEKGRRSLLCSLTEHRNATFRSILSLAAPPKSTVKALVVLRRAVPDGILLCKGRSKEENGHTDKHYGAPQVVKRFERVEEHLASEDVLRIGSAASTSTTRVSPLESTWTAGSRTASSPW